MMKNRVKSAFTDNKVAIIASIIILFSSLIIGYYFADSLNVFLNPIAEEMTKNVKNGTIQLTFKSLFSNNIKIVFLMFLLGVVFCFSAVILAFNGLFVGYYVGNADDLQNALLLIVPHGIFEFSSCILACASGFVLFRFVLNFFKTLINDNNLINAYNENADKLIQAVILLMIAVILMVIAGVIEAYLTIPIADFISSILS